MAFMEKVEKEELITIIDNREDKEEEERITEMFNDFLKENFPEYKLTSYYSAYILKKNHFYSFSTYARIYFYKDWISVETNEDDLELIKEIFTKFVDECFKIKVNIEVKNGD